MRIVTDTVFPERPYRPVVIIHGLMNGDVSTMQYLATRISELHPGTKTYVINRFCGLASLEPLWRQTRQLADELLQVCSSHPEGVHVIGYSQGGLIARGMLEMCGDRHNVKTFISLSSPQGGQFGAECFTKILPALTTRTAYEVFYTRLAQHALSVANFWYDPWHRDLYLNYSLYLAVIDDANRHNVGRLQQNTAPSDRKTVAETSGGDTPKTIETRVPMAIATVAAATDKVSEGHEIDKDSVAIATDVDTILADISVNDADYYCGDHSSNNGDSNSNVHIGKLGLSRLERLVLIGGPDDGVISPWQSSLFAVLNSAGQLLSLQDRRENDVYSDDDPIGLRELGDTERIIQYTEFGVRHHEWHHSERVLRHCIINWLN